jgi:hypothetical protein
MATAPARIVTVRVPIWGLVILAVLLVAGLTVAGYLIGNSGASDQTEAARAHHAAELAAARSAQQRALARGKQQGYSQGVGQGRLAGTTAGRHAGALAGAAEGQRRAAASAAAAEAAQQASAPNHGCPANTHASGSACIGDGSPQASPIGGEQTCSGGKECEVPSQTPDRPQG